MSNVQIKDEHGVRIITLNRPEKRNALDLQMYAQLTEYLIQGDCDNEIKAFLIHGQAGDFTSGNDIADFLKNNHLGTDHPAFRFLFCLLDLQKPIVAAVSGAAVGIGTTMLLHCDLVYADASAKFQLPFVNLALVPEAASSLILPQLIGHVKAAQLLMLGESFSAKDAVSYQIVNQVIDTQCVLAFALTKAQQLSKQPPQAIKATKRLMKSNKDQIRKQMELELADFETSLRSDEAKARFSAFLTKRTSS